MDKIKPQIIQFGIETVTIWQLTLNQLHDLIITVSQEAWVRIPPLPPLSQAPWAHRAWTLNLEVQLK